MCTSSLTYEIPEVFLKSKISSILVSLGLETLAIFKHSLRYFQLLIVANLHIPIFCMTVLSLFQMRLVSAKIQLIYQLRPT